MNGLLIGDFIDDEEGDEDFKLELEDQDQDQVVVDEMEEMEYMGPGFDSGLLELIFDDS